jgi:hypothetical protein
MSRYRRVKIDGGLFFFTLALPTDRAVCWSATSTAHGAPTRSRTSKRSPDERSEIRGQPRPSIPLTPWLGAMQQA